MISPRAGAARLGPKSFPPPRAPRPATPVPGASGFSPRHRRAGWTHGCRWSLVHLGRRGRKVDQNFRTDAELTVDGKLSAEAFDDVLGNRKAEASSRSPGGEVRVEDVRHVFG